MTPAYLLSRSSSLAQAHLHGSAAVPVFFRLAQSLNNSTFQLALGALLYFLDHGTQCEVCIRRHNADISRSGVIKFNRRIQQLTDRIIAPFLLFSLYAPHPISLNPFKSTLVATFLRERENALAAVRNGGMAPNEPLLWTLWKILTGDGDDIGPYSPNTLARSTCHLTSKNEGIDLDEALALSDAHESAHNTAQEEDVAHATRLFLAARTRILSLAEQRQLAPHLHALAASEPMLLALPDLAPLAAHNPTIAVAILRAHLTRPTASASSESAAANGSCLPAPRAAYLSAHVRLPPTLPTFNVLGRLLRDPDRTISALSDSMGPRKRSGREGLAMGMMHLCRFYTSLIKLGLVDLADDADTVAMAHFSLQNARVVEANALYRLLVGARGEV
ncbi:hypothetical protein FB451DRAFT_1404257 [Mycena latifolia]|nr:hypothetical protein FB451DRAFT_1404257 [Mycena latifolia]